MMDGVRDDEHWDRANENARTHTKELCLTITDMMLPFETDGAGRVWRERPPKAEERLVHTRTR